MVGWCDGLRAGGRVCDRMADEAYGQVEPKELTAEEQSVLREVFDKFDEVCTKKAAGLLAPTLMCVLAPRRTAAAALMRRSSGTR